MIDRLYRNKTAHLVPWDVYYARPALCGFTPWPHHWHGTRNPDEYTRAESLLTCAQCKQLWRE